MQPPGPRGKSRLAVDSFLAAVWLACTLCTLWFAVQSSGELPKFDEWVEMVPVVSGGEPLTLEWLWTPVSEHRIPLPRLAYLAAYEVSGGDFRSGACLSVLLLSIVAVLCMLFARRCRGSALVDAFFPLILLHWGQAHSFTLGINLQFVIPTVLGYLALLLVLSPQPFTMRRGFLFSLLVLGMSLCGTTGVLVAVPLTGWLAVVGMSRLRLTEPARSEGIVFLGMAALLLAIIGLYFVYFRWVDLPPRFQAIVNQRGLSGRVETMGVLLSMSLGWVGRAFWPLTGVLVFLVASAASWAVVLEARAHPRERLRISGWLAFMAASVLLVGGVGWGRSFTVGEHLWSTTRYATLAIPLLVNIYLASLVFFTPAAGAFTRALLGATALVVFAGHLTGADNYPYALQWVRTVRYGEEAVIRAAVSGASSEHLVRMIRQYVGDPRGVPSMEMFRAARLGPFGFTDPERRPYVGLNLHLSDPAAGSYLDTGWSNGTDGEARWTVEPRAVVHFALEPGVPRQLTIVLKPFQVSGQVGCDVVRIELNGSELTSLRLDRADWTRHTIALPEPVVGRINSLALQFPDASCNERAPGAYVKSLRID